jgi:hypothetical protein
MFAGFINLHPLLSGKALESKESPHSETRTGAMI